MWNWNGWPRIPDFDRLKVLVMMISLQNIVILGAQSLLMLMGSKFLMIMTRLLNIKIKNDVLWPGHLYQKLWPHQHQEALSTQNTNVFSKVIVTTFNLSETGGLGCPFFFFNKAFLVLGHSLLCLECFGLDFTNYIPYVAKYWWGKILANLANHSYVAKINPTKILPLNTEFIAPVIIISCKHGRLVEYRTYSWNLSWHVINHNSSLFDSNGRRIVRVSNLSFVG